MGVARVSLSLVGLIALVALVISGAAIWLMLTDPVTVADALNEGQVTPLVRELAAVIVTALQGLLRYF